MFRLLRPSTITSLLVVVALTLTACGNDRPAVAAWQQDWARVTAAMPTEQAVTQDGSGSVCSEAVAFLRANRTDLFPTPDLAIDDTVKDWVQIAEDTFFECPPNNDKVTGFADAYRELLRLQGEVDLVIDIDQ